VLAGIAVQLLGTMAACDSLPGSGPSSSEIFTAAKPAKDGGTRFALVDVDPNVVAVMETWSAASLQGSFGRQGPALSQVIGVGDYVQVVIWDASVSSTAAPIADRATSGARTGTIPEQVVGADGRITVPYAGRVQAAGRTPPQVEQAIVAALEHTVVQPQALVTVTRNVANTVTVVGEVAAAARVPLTPRGDRLLDVVATAGGARAPVHEVFVTLVRGRQALRVPMQAILLDPAENVYVRPGDVVSVARDPQTFTAAGATGANAVIPFDAIGISLEQAIARAGGLNDNRADPSGVFVIRFERPEDYDQLRLPRPQPGPTAQVPVAYRIDMRNPNSFFVARRFPIHNKDIVFVSNAPTMDIQKAMTILLPFLGAGATAATVGAVTTR
jgi:polysaccharide biosynthesis/export protein